MLTWLYELQEENFCSAEKIDDTIEVCFSDGTTVELEMEEELEMIQKQNLATIKINNPDATWRYQIRLLSTPLYCAIFSLNFCLYLL